MKTLICLVAILSLGACAQHHGHVSHGAVIKSNPAQTVVKTPYGTYKYHCPPGQRKKGNC
jgi:hypothetical protein